MFEFQRASNFADRHLGNNPSTHSVESQSLIDNIEDGNSSNESDNGIIAANTTNASSAHNRRASCNNPFKRFSGHDNYDFHPLVNENLEKNDKSPHTAHESILLPNICPPKIDTLKGLKGFKTIAKKTSETMDSSPLSSRTKLPSDYGPASKTEDAVPTPPSKIFVTKLTSSLIDSSDKVKTGTNDEPCVQRPGAALNRFKALAKKASLPLDGANPTNLSKASPIRNESTPTISVNPPDTVPETDTPVKPINRFKNLAKKTSEIEVPETKTSKLSTDSAPALTGVSRFKSLAKKTSEIDAPANQTPNKLRTADAPALSGISKFKSLAKKTSEIEAPNNDSAKLSTAVQTVPPAVNRFKNLAKNTSSADPNIKNGNISIVTNNQLKLPTPNEQQAPNFMTLVNTVTTVNKVSKMGRLKVRDKLKEQMKKIVEERLSVKQIFARYVEASTLHGFRYTCMDTYLIRRIFWAVLMIFGFVYFLWKLDGGIREYLTYPFSTLSTLDYVDKVQYPAISICIINQFRYSKILENPRMKELYDQGRLPLHRNWSNFSQLKDIPGDVLLEGIQSTSFQLGDILKGCDYIRRDTEMPKTPKRYCGADNFTSYFSDSGQLCYQLNSQETIQPLEVSFSGLRYGLDLIFDLDNNDTIMNHDFVALQVIIHDPNEPPQSNSGFMVAPGFKTYISMQRVETSNLEPPYDTQCGERALKYFDTYNQKACLLEKLTNYTGEECNCREPFMPDNGLELCSLQKTINCMYHARDSFNEFEKRSGCPVDCNVITYKNKVSTARFLHNPPIGVEKAILEATVKLNGNFTTEGHVLTLFDKMGVEALDKHIEENVIVVLFFFGDMTIIKNEQEVSFDFYQFLGEEMLIIYIIRLG